MQTPVTQDPSRALIDAWPYLAGLIVAAVVGGLLILAIRRTLLSKASVIADESLMQTLRRMRDTGELSHDEYEASVRSIATRVASRKAPEPGGLVAQLAHAEMAAAEFTRPVQRQSPPAASSPPPGPARTTAPIPVVSKRGPQPTSPVAAPPPATPSSQPPAQHPRPIMRETPAAPSARPLPAIDDFPPLIELPPEGAAPGQ